MCTDQIAGVLAKGPLLVLRLDHHKLVQKDPYAQDSQLIFRRRPLGKPTQLLTIPQSLVFPLVSQCPRNSFSGNNPSFFHMLRSRCSTNLHLGHCPDWRSMVCTLPNHVVSTLMRFDSISSIFSRLLYAHNRTQLRELKKLKLFSFSVSQTNMAVGSIFLKVRTIKIKNIFIATGRIRSETFSIRCLHRMIVNREKSFTKLPDAISIDIFF